MDDEFDFSGAERGKFFEDDATFSLPVYLDDEVLQFVQEIANRRGADVSTIVNALIRSDMQLAEAMK